MRPDSQLVTFSARQATKGDPPCAPAWEVRRWPHSPSVMSALLVSTFPSINFSTASVLQRIPLKMETLNRKSS